jgi:Tol biopolymer transport system component
MLRRLDSTSFQNLAGTAGARGLSWSRDSRFLAFSMGSTLKRIDINGGPPQDLCDFPSNNPPFTAWSPAGAILFSGPDGGIWRVSSAGGAPAPVTSSNPSGQGSELHMAPQVLPDGRHFLYLAQADRAERNGIFAGSLDAPSGQPGKLILNSIWSGIYAPGLHGLGSLLLRRGSSLVAQPFDLAGLALAGEPVPVAPEVASYGPLLSVSVSDNGTLVYTAKRADGADNRLLWLDREGKRLGEAGQPGTYLDYNLSPDEKRIAAARIDANNVMDIWILDLGSGGVQTRFTFAPAQFFRFPVWSPDGTRIIFASSRGAASGGTFEKPANGTGAERRIAEGVGFPTDWSRDGRFILSASAGDLWVQTDGKATRITQTSFNEQQAQFSPDGKWIAYVSDESRRNEVWVMSYPPTGARFQVSTAGGRRPRWRGDGRELFYIAADSRMMATAVKTSPNFELGATAPLFQVEDSLGYAVTADGRRFLMRTNLKENAPPPITVMTDWLSAVKH